MNDKLITDTGLEFIKNNKLFFDNFTRKEEYNLFLHDKFNRFAFHQSKNRDIFNPSVSQNLIENGYSPKYPENKSFAVCLTHDIDSINKPFLSRCFSCAMSVYNKQNIMQNVSSIFKRKLLFNLNEIMELEEKYNAKSTFYFLALHKGEQDFNYNIEDIKYTLKEIDDKGWEVGLHGGHEAYNNYNKLIEEKKRLEDAFGKNVVGYRNHYLHFKVPDTWEILSKAGFKYDATFGYADCVGFRNGMCHPYYPYNLNTDKEINIVEIPLVVMDGTLFDGYMRLTKEDALCLIKELIDKVAELHGVFTLLWHNSYLIKGTWQREMYEDILKYCNEKNAWMTSGKEIYEWFIQSD